MSRISSSVRTRVSASEIAASSDSEEQKSAVGRQHRKFIMQPPMRCGNSPSKQVKSGHFLPSVAVGAKAKTVRKRRRHVQKENVQQIEITLPPQDRPNFLRKGAQAASVKVDFDDRWQSFLEMKKMSDARTRIYRAVYFRRWKMRYSESYVAKIQKKTLAINESLARAGDSRRRVSHEGSEEISTIDLIRMARSKIDELTSRDTTYLEEQPRRHSASCEHARVKEPVTGQHNDETSDECQIDDLSIPVIDAPAETPTFGRTLDQGSGKLEESMDFSNSSLIKSRKLKAETDDLLNEESLTEDGLEFEIGIQSPVKADSDASDREKTHQKHHRKTPKQQISSSEPESGSEELQREGSQNVSSFMSRSYLSMSNHSTTAANREQNRTSLADSFSAGPAIPRITSSHRDRHLGSGYRSLVLQDPLPVRERRELTQTAAMSFQIVDAKPEHHVVPVVDDSMIAFNVIDDTADVKGQEEPEDKAVVVDDESSGLEFNIVDSSEAEL